MIRTLDLFTGIGGFAWALRGVTQVVGYCDLDEDCRACISRNIRAGRLGDAPIFTDVCKLTKEDMGALRPQMITAGFPCQDISCANPKALGIVAGKHSRLFFEVVRLASVCPDVRHVFLENSVCIRSRGLKEVVTSLGAIGFVEFAYAAFAAEDVGAPHQRRRWFCIATRDPGSLRRVSVPVENATFDWSRVHTQPRIVARRTPDKRDPEARAIENTVKMLGNAVVPPCVASAFACLVASLVDPPTSASDRSLVRVSRIHDMGDATTVRVPRFGDVVVPLITRVELVDDEDPDKVTHVATRWATPTVTRFRQSPQGPRTVVLYANQVFLEKETWRQAQSLPLPRNVQRPARPKDVSAAFLINPVFTESLMGYPPGWTR